MTLSGGVIGPSRRSSSDCTLNQSFSSAHFGEPSGKSKKSNPHPLKNPPTPSTKLRPPEYLFLPPGALHLPSSVSRGQAHAKRKPPYLTQRRQS
ncbi:hypothetical protein Cadr_000024798 [Camelus dromedarius]|uniref:Uncharacterized protein n=1 Tax=Camelus dromedarius TaxID=9838 RepID=A0A5N4CQ33_CAMDR|nr:hypothetical protein Cadr_000024798 [Camelus dromedarius]